MSKNVLSEYKWMDLKQSYRIQIFENGYIGMTIICMACFVNLFLKF